MKLTGKKVIALGERDGVQGEAISECVRSVGAEVVLQSTKCFV
jgi:glycine reductase